MFTHIDISHLICRANQVTGFYMMGTLVVKRLKKSQAKRVSDIFKKKQRTNSDNDETGNDGSSELSFNKEKHFLKCYSQLSFYFWSE